MYPEFAELANKFRWEFEPQTISWSFKKNIDKKQAFKRSGNEFGKKIEKIFQRAARVYEPYWKKEIKKKLKDFREKLKKEERCISKIVEKIEDFTLIPFRSKIINIYLVEALSSEYKVGAEPVSNGIAIGIVKDSKLLKMVITHELIHLNLLDSIVKIIPEKYRKDERKINEAVTDLITAYLLKVPIKSKNLYVNLFKSYFQKNKNMKSFPKFLKSILA